jgi:hypothetical protein
MFTNTLSGVMIKGSNPDKTRFLLVSTCAIFLFFNPARFLNLVGLAFYFLLFWA